MATTQLEFQQVADELKAEFLDFFKPAIFTLLGDYDPLSGTTTGDINFNADALREEYASNQIDGNSVRANDFKLLIVASELTESPTTDGIQLTYDGKSMLTVVGGFLDAANAMWTLQVRG